MHYQYHFWGQIFPGYAVFYVLLRYQDVSKLFKY